MSNFVDAPIADQQALEKLNRVFHLQKEAF